MDMFPQGGKHPCGEALVLGGRGGRGDLEPGKAKSLEEGGGALAILLNFLELEDVVGKAAIMASTAVDTDVVLSWRIETPPELAWAWRAAVSMATWGCSWS